MVGQYITLYVLIHHIDATLEENHYHFMAITEDKQAYSKYKHSLTFHIWHAAMLTQQ